MNEDNYSDELESSMPANHIFWEKCDENASEFIPAKYCLHVKVLNTTEYRAWMFYKPISRIFLPSIFNDAE